MIERDRLCLGATQCRVALALALSLGGAATVHAQTKPAPVASAATARPVKTEQGPAWSALKPAQREALKPLERDWASFDSLGKRKWLEIAARYPAMPPDEQARLQARMTEWARLTPQERGQVRLHYQEAKQVPPQERQASWEAYQALPPEQRRELANRAAPASASASGHAKAEARAASTAPTGAHAQDPLHLKANTVSDPALAARPKAVAPAVVQATPGATTTLISKPQTPPAHQQSGMPKIAATPEFVDKKTLLPQAGAQSARPAAASAPPTRP
jgi:hypothetical protein